MSCASAPKWQAPAATAKKSFYQQNGPAQNSRQFKTPSQMRSEYSIRRKLNGAQGVERQLM
jgi:hypothetical protein